MIIVKYFRYSFHHHEVHPIVLNLMYSIVYFDKYKYEKISFENVAGFFAPDRFANMVNDSLNIVCFAAVNILLLLCIYMIFIYL